MHIILLCDLIGASFHGLDAIDSYVKTFIEKFPMLSYIYMLCKFYRYLL